MYIISVNVYLTDTNIRVIKMQFKIYFQLVFNIFLQHFSAAFGAVKTNS